MKNYGSKYTRPSKEKRAWLVRKHCSYRCGASLSCGECFGKGWNLGYLYKVNEPDQRIIYPSVDAATMAKWKSKLAEPISNKGAK